MIRPMRLLACLTLVALGLGNTAPVHAELVVSEIMYNPSSAEPDLGSPGGTLGNGGPTLGACGDTATPISAVQGTGSASPLDGTQVVVEAVVVADFQGSDELRSYFLQEEATDDDGDPLSSEGIFVFDSTNAVNVGDRVRILGVVDEFFDKTQINNVSDFALCSSGNPLPAATPVTLPLASGAFLERYEGMRVSFAQTLTVTELFNLGRFGEVLLSHPARLYNPTAVAEPGMPAQTVAAQNALAQMLLDDGSSQQNPVPAPFGITASDPIRAGDTVTGLTGVMDYSFGDYRVQPTAAVNFNAVNPRPATPPMVGGTLQVASFNVLNFFTTLDSGPDICGPAGNLGCRGADNQTEFFRQLNKLVAALQALDADIVGLMELENNEMASLDALVASLNAVVGVDTYAYIDTGFIGSDAIKVGLIYKPASVTPVDAFAILDSSVDARFNDDRNRPVLAQNFTDNATGTRFTVAVNHFKSKGDSDLEDTCPTPPGENPLDCDQGDGQGYWNHTRTQGALALADWLDDPAFSPRVLIIGDLNAYDKEDPIDALRAAGYLELLFEELGELFYGYVFFGEYGYLDYALASPAMADFVTGVAGWTINSDEPRAYDYNDFNQASLYAPGPYRSSDHDPVLVGLAFSPEIFADDFETASPPND